MDVTRLYGQKVCSEAGLCSDLLILLSLKDYIDSNLMISTLDSESEERKIVMKKGQSISDRASLFRLASSDS